MEYGIQSDALTKNMDITNVKVDVPSSFEVLEKAVSGYAGKEQQARDLLVEYHHRYRNWTYVVQEAARYAATNMRLYHQHPLNGSVIFLLSRILVEALRQSERPEVRSLAADHLLDFWFKLLDEMPEEIAKPLPGGVTMDSADRMTERDTSCHQGVLRFYFKELAELPETAFESLLRSFYQPKRLAAKLTGLWSDPSSFGELRTLLRRMDEETYRFWLSREDPRRWLGNGEKPYSAQWAELCRPLSYEQYREYLRILKTEVDSEPDDLKAVGRLCELIDYHDIVRLYYVLPERLKALAGPSDATYPGLLMRLKIMETRGLEAIQEETLREINFGVAKWIRHESVEKLQGFLTRIFEVLYGCLQSYPQAALQIVRTVGLEVVDTEDKVLIDLFLKHIVKMGFQTPQLGGVSQHWQVEVNPAHLPNIRIWLEIIRKNPDRTRLLLSALVVNLFLGGIYVRDTDLFQKDVSQLLHSPIRPVYNMIKQLAKIFPVYFNQIGAEGQLRTVSTDVDELTARSDRLIHFLRKQSHVESNNIVVTFIQAIIEFWRSRDKSPLAGLVPVEIYAEIPESGPMVDEMHRIFESVFRTPGVHHVSDLLELSESEIRLLIGKVSGVSEREEKRAFLIIQFYQLLNEKYALSFKDIRVHLQRAANLGLPDPEPLLEALDSRHISEKLEAILDYLLKLKEIILTPGELNFLENIYIKRHIAVDIPSMYGSYNEMKFDALGLTFRLENLANVLFEELILTFNLGFITRSTFFRIAKVLPLFLKALEIDGITSNRLESQKELFLKALVIPRFSHSQYIDIFRGFSEAIKQIIQTNYHNLHEENLDIIIKQLGEGQLLQRYSRGSDGELPAERNQRVSESFLRDLIARTFGLQYFDHFIAGILTTLATQREELSVDMLDLLLSYDQERTTSYIYEPNPRTFDLIHMGNKAYTLARLHAIGIRVPPAFVITTEYFRCRSVIEGFAHSNEDFQNRVMSHIKKLEKETGRGFGVPENPLLLSVRSGAAVSMPGMMNTFLNVGINEAIVKGLIRQTGEAWFAWDNYRRFVQSWAMSFGMQRDEFDSVMNHYKKRYRRHVKRDFSAREMKELALAYRNEIAKHEIDLSESPEDQLFTAISQVMKSWNAPKAVTYREIMGLSENWGTAVAIQSMVFGNLDTQSGAGVMFTHNPRTSEDKVDPVGDFTLGNQGEDVVGGLVKTLPLSKGQRLSEGDDHEPSLEILFPKVYGRLVDVARELIYKQHWAPQEIEFTFQGSGEDGLYILQSRNMAPRVKRDYPVFTPSEELHGAYVGSGIGVSGGALSGMVAFDLESIQRLRKEHEGQPIILLRSDTVPDDIREISIADGILTGKGGATSHAAVVAHRLGKIAVVGFSKMRVWESERKCVIDEHVLHSGDFIGIDGRSGAIYLGHHETGRVEMFT